jgi:hypothetical protein
MGPYCYIAAGCRPQQSFVRWEREVLTLNDQLEFNNITLDYKTTVHTTSPKSLLI